MILRLLRYPRFGLGVLLVLGLAGGVIGATWLVTERGIQVQRRDAEQRANALVVGLAASYTEQISRQILALDQTLDTLVREWEKDPRGFNLEVERGHAKSLAGISRDMFLADQNGIIRQASVSDFIGQGAGDLDVFHDAAEHTNDKPTLYLGSASVNPLMRQWHLDAARTLHHPDGSFAGIIDADYRVSAISDIFAASAPPGDNFAAVVDLTSGKLRATYGAAGGTPDANIADTKMFAAIDSGDSGIWVGPSATDTTVRVHAFRRVPGRDLVVVAGVNLGEVMQPVATWQRQARIFATAITSLTVIIAVLLLGGLCASRRRGVKAADANARFAAANALAEVSRAGAEAIHRRLHATFAAVSDGIAIFDAHLNLVEWNELFPERSGVNLSFLRTGMPMEDVLRTQAVAGYFGQVADLDAEIERRVALLRAGNFGTSLSFHAASRVIELRCRPLIEGGFVALYTDVTENRRARQSLREAREALRGEQSARMRFLDVISHELSARVTSLMRAIGRLQSTGVPARTLEPILRVGESLSSLATDTVEVPLMEAGAVTVQPALIGVRPLLREIVDAIQPGARDRGITVYQVVNDAAPAELIADPERIRQIVSVLFAEAMRFASPDTIWLLADGGDQDGCPDGTGAVALRVTIRGFGAPIPDPQRAAMFPDFNALAVPGRTAAGPMTSDAMGTGLEPAIARHLATLMRGQVRCEAWSTLDGRTGNDFILTLPPDLLPGQRGRAPGQAPAEGRPLPRTRVLLAGALTGLRMAAVTMLRRDGHMVDAVASGEEAVWALRDAPYDIAFLDAVLPDTTIEAAIASIRDLTGSGRVVPLVVFAPPHEENEAAAWRATGANAILGVNPTLQELAEAISEQVWLSRTAGPLHGSMPGFGEDSEEGIPILSIERLEELRSNIQREELIDMVEECISDLYHRLPALRRSLAIGSVGAITAQTHAMVGMAGGYGMAVLEARLRAVMTAVRVRRLDTIDGAAAVIEADLARAAEALRRTLRLPTQAPAKVRS